jgi:hypothetical protein
MNLKKEVKNIKRKISAEPIITVDNEYRLKQSMYVKIAGRLTSGSERYQLSQKKSC